MVQNHVDQQNRLAFVQSTMRTSYHLEKLNIVPVEYDETCPFSFNNFIYKIELPSPYDAVTNPTIGKPGSVAIPNGTKELILRLSNTQLDGVSRDNRVENEVAFIMLATAALEKTNMKVIPKIYGWGSAADQSAQGWILQEFMPGRQTEAGLKGLNLDSKNAIFAQLATILKAFQEYEIPQSITKHGGLTINEHGLPVSAAMTIINAGPWSTHEESWRDRLQLALAEADENKFIAGWKANGIRKRLEAFVKKGLSVQFAGLENTERKIIVHHDFARTNVLYDPESLRVTALLDFDFSSISHPSYEFFSSFSGLGEPFRGWMGDDDSEQSALRIAKLHGFPTPLPATTEEGVDWETVKAWEDQLEKAGVQRPSTMKGISELADVDVILREMIPWRLTDADVLRIQSEEVIMRFRAETEKRLDRMLERLGF